MCVAAMTNELQRRMTRTEYYRDKRARRANRLCRRRRRMHCVCVCVLNLMYLRFC